MLPATITKIHQAFKEIKHMAIDTWQEECRFAARRAMKEVLETRMHNAVDAHLNEMRPWVYEIGEMGGSVPTYSRR